jgi:hypothetical protein
MFRLRKFVDTLKAEQNEDELLTLLLQRIAESLVIEDRRAALQELLNILSKNVAAHSSFAGLGFATLCSAIRNDVDDPFITKTALECIALVTNGAHAEDQGPAVNAEQFARTEGALPLLMNLLDGPAARGLEGFHIKYLVLQIIGALLDANAAFTQQAIMALPKSMSQLAEIIDDQEVLRNETIVVLQRLVRNHVTAQQVGGPLLLHKLLQVMKEEDWMLGGVVVADCLQLMQFLVGDNPYNRKILVEMRLYNTLEQVLTKEASALQSSASTTFSADRSRNIHAALCVIDFDAKSVPQPSLIHAVAVIATHPNSGSAAHAGAWQTLALAITRVQDVVDAALDTKQLGFAHAALSAALHAPEALEQNAAREFLLVMCRSNPGLQLQLAEDVARNVAEGIGFIEAIYGDSDVESMRASSIAAMTLAVLLIDNLDAKQALGPVKPPGKPTSLLETCAQLLAKSITVFGAQQEGQQATTRLSLAAIAWLHSFPPAVATFLQAIKRTPFLVGVLLSEDQFGPASSLIRGLCAVLLGLCCIYAAPGAAVDPVVLFQAIDSQVTLPRYCQILDELCTILSTGRSSISPQWVLWLQEVIPELHQEVQTAILGPNVATMPAGPLQAKQLPPNSSANRVPDAQVRDKNGVAGGSQLAAPPSTINFANCNASNVPNVAQILPAPLDSAIMSNSAMTVAESSEINALRQEVAQLRQRIAEAELEATTSRSAEQSARATLAKVEADLEGLSREYAALDAHASELQTRLDGAMAMPVTDVDALVRATREEMRQEADSVMEDLLVCLGQEEAKVARLKELCVRNGLQTQLFDF